jgi:hypothetical protein
LIATKPWLPALVATALGAIDWASASSSWTRSAVWRTRRTIEMNIDVSRFGQQVEC